jgi:rhodanese-related sulfurtransferase
MLTLYGWAGMEEPHRCPYHRAEFDPNRRVILHCAAGGRSALAADTLQQMGYSDVAHLDGGFTAWKQAGQPVEGDSGS